MRRWRSDFSHFDTDDPDPDKPGSGSYWIRAIQHYLVDGALTGTLGNMGLFWPKAGSSMAKSRLLWLPWFPCIPVYSVFSVYSRVFRVLYLWSFLIASWEPAVKPAITGNTREYREYREYTRIRPYGP